jgi:hypothetical protein
MSGTVVTPIVRRVDHLNIVVPSPRGLFDVLTHHLELPIERPWARFAAFESGQAMLDIGHEPIVYAPGRATGVPSQAGIFAIAFEPEPLDRALPELARRGVPHSWPYEFSVTYPDDPSAHAQDERVRGGARRRRWTLVGLGGLLGDRQSAKDLSRWPRRGDARAGRAIGRLAGRAASGRLGGVLAARLGSNRPFCFLCEFHSFDVAASRSVISREVGRRRGGPLGLLRTHEIVVTARDIATEQERWRRLLAPTMPDATGSWKLGDGPAIRLAEGTDDRISTLRWQVESLSRAADWLRPKGWLGHQHDGEVSIAPAALQGLDVRLVEQR